MEAYGTFQGTIAASNTGQEDNTFNFHAFLLCQSRDQRNLHILRPPWVLRKTGATLRKLL